MAESIHETNSQGITQETSQQRLIRREKLLKLQEEGNDPFQITRYVVDNDSANIKEHFDAPSVSKPNTTTRWEGADSQLAVRASYFTRQIIRGFSSKRRERLG